MNKEKIEFNYDNLHESLNKLNDDLNKLHDIIQIAKGGIKQAQMIPKINDFLLSIKDHDSGLNEEKVESGLRVAKIATQEVEEDFPFLNSQAIVMFYSYLESAIKDLIIGFFRNNLLSKLKELQNLKVTLSEYLAMDENEKYEYLFSLFEKSITTGIQYGTTRFENLLQPIGLNGYIPSSISKTIYELSQIRNNILHKSGIADRHLIKSCPWFEYKIGDRVDTNSKNYERYHEAVNQYLIILGWRLMIKRGIDPSEFNKFLSDIKLNEFIGRTEV